MADCRGDGKDRKARTLVREAYGRIASEGSCGCAGSCCGGNSDATVSGKIGYSADELEALPEGADLGLGCGNPGALASLKPGEAVLDLGSGAGIDAFLAGKRVGASGRVIGVDMTPAMLDRARNNLAGFRERSGIDNVEFRLGEIESLPVADNSVDIVISNCVINLSPEKPRVWREIFRVLKPGGRVSISDLALLAPLPDRIRESATALVACIGGAVTVAETLGMAKKAGLVDIGTKTKAYPAEAIAEISDPLYREMTEALPRGKTFGDYVVSLSLTAHKPARIRKE